ncbi:hypothetical protein GNI_145030 [Gregarina niphandrodes]|uniref:Uncharacterized protein n=1 Tax=Gregarina niphandrodes TaxID=110365 RepID=A0A023AZV3_GRENI|nr:hypothetical protein GNI_145030 [Gregarina niphandrodes]EZG44637.1 hypothetical protein GNI_145030 [Gregarina niphandrodes]|eukprot:XP_011134142.1 hypothetical protein GNI_145030 [Gregarina niphandrodes]
MRGCRSYGCIDEGISGLLLLQMKPIQKVLCPHTLELAPDEAVYYLVRTTALKKLLEESDDTEASVWSVPISAAKLKEATRTKDLNVAEVVVGTTESVWQDAPQPYASEGRLLSPAAYEKLNYYRSVYRFKASGQHHFLTRKGLTFESILRSIHYHDQPRLSRNTTTIPTVELFQYPIEDTCQIENNSFADFIIKGRVTDIIAPAEVLIALERTTSCAITTTPASSCSDEQ